MGARAVARSGNNNNANNGFVYVNANNDSSNANNNIGSRLTIKAHCPHVRHGSAVFIATPAPPTCLARQGARERSLGKPHC